MPQSNGNNRPSGTQQLNMGPQNLFAGGNRNPQMQISFAHRQSTRLKADASMVKTLMDMGFSKS